MTSEVTQADRDAAAPFAIGFGYIDGYSFSDSHLIRNGRKDDHALVQAFARHRLTAQSGEGRSGAGEDALLEDVIANAIAANVRLEWHGHDHASINPRSITIAARAVLAALRATDDAGGA